MSLRTDIINLIVNINGDKAKDKLNELRKKASDISLELDGMTKGTAQYVAKSQELRKVDTEIASIKKEAGLASLSLKELGQERRRLTSILKSTPADDKGLSDLKRQYQAVVARQSEVQAGMFGMKNAAISSFSSIKQNITSLIGSYIGFQAIVGGIKSLISGSIKLSDQLSDLRRVAGLTAVEADNLNHALLQIDTRTSGQGLLSIAIIAGKLGVAKGELLSFTEAVDKLVVTLGDELGDADQITSQLGKILNVFDGKVTGENISHLGNSIVDLANKGVATGGFIVDFTQRVSGIAKASGLSLGATVGLAAGLESLGLRSESSSTAIQKLLTTIGSNIPKAAKVAGVPLKEFNELFASKPQEALIRYAEGLVKNKKSFSEITAGFKDAGEEGARIVQTLQAIGQQGDFMREQIQLGSASIKELTALNEGFALKNDNLAGSIEKVGKQFDKLVASKGVSSFLKGLADDTNDLFKSMTQFSEVGIGTAITRAMQGLGILVKDGPQAFKKFREEQQKLMEIEANRGKDGVLDPNSKNVFLLPEDGPKVPEILPPIDPAAGDKARKSEYNQLKKDYDQFLKELAALKQKADAGKLDDADREISEVQNKYAELLQRAADYHKKLNTLDSTYNEQTKQLIKQKLEEIQAIRDKFFAKNSEDEYQESIKNSNDYFDQLKRNTERQFAEGKLSKKEYEAALLDIENRAINNRIIIANDYSATAKKAAEDVKKFTIDQENQITENKRTQKELREKLDEEQTTAAGKLAQINFKNSKPKLQRTLLISDANAERDEKIKKLKDDLKESGIAFTDETIKDMPIFKEAWATFNEQVADANNNFWKGQIEQVLTYVNIFQEALGSINQILNNSENKQLQQDRKVNEQKKDNLKKQLDGKVLSQAQYQKKIDALEAQQEEKEKVIRKKQAEREKALALFQALVGTASAVISALGAKPWTPANFAFAGVVAALGALQIAAIATAPLPEAAEGNWFRKGDKHRDPSGGIPVMIERDEAVIKADAMTDTKQYTVTGTPSQITSKLNSLHGGVNWAAGATIQQPKFRERAPEMNSNLPLIMALGGVAFQTRRNSLSNNRSNQAFEEMMNNKFDEVNNKFDKVIEVFERKQDALHAVVSIKEYRKKEKEYDDAKKASGMSQ